MKRSQSTTPREAPWPPPAPQVAAAIFAATLQGKVTEQEIDAVEGLPPSEFPRELMIKLGFNSPPEDPAAEQAVEELKQQGYPKTDYDPGNGETFPTFPEGVVCNRDHPLYDMMPDNARPENWGEMESAEFNPSKAQSIWEQPEDEQAPVTDERIDAAIIAAIRSGTIGENELATIRRTSKSEWPEALWVILGLPAPEDAPVRVRVYISTSGTFHHITHNHDIHPYEGDEYFQASRIEVKIYDTRLTGEDANTPLHSVDFSNDDESLGIYSRPPHLPRRGVVDDVVCFGTTVREIDLKVNQEIPVELGSSGISIGTHTIPWSDVTKSGRLDCFYDLTAYWDDVPLGRELTRKLYIGNEKNPSPGRANLLAMLGEIHYIAAHTTGRYAGLSSMEILRAAGDDPFFLLKCALSLPWERARHIREPDELNRWMREHHPESPEYKGSQKTTETKAEPDSIDASDGDGDQGSEWPPDSFRILCAMRAARMAGSMTSQDVERMDEGPPETWPADLWNLLGFSPPLPCAKLSIPPQPEAPLGTDLGSPVPPASQINVRAEVASQGTFHHITHDYYTHPYEGEEFVRFTKIQVSVYDTQSVVDGLERLLRTVTFRQADGTLGVHAKPPEPPWRGTIDEVGCFSRMEREFSLPGGSDIHVELDARGISVGDHMITWSEVTEKGGLDCYYSVTAYGHGIPLASGLTERLYHGNELRVGPKRAILAALVDQIDYIVANSPSEHYGRSPVRALDAAADNPNVLIEIVFAMPWERARNILGPTEFANWLEENHPASPSRPVPPPPKTPSDSDQDKPEWPPDITPLTPGGEVALNALLIGLKTKGLLTDEFISAEEGEILLNKPFLKWPPELQAKLMPHGAGPAIR